VSPREIPGVLLNENSWDTPRWLSALLSGVGSPAAEVAIGGWPTTGVDTGSSAVNPAGSSVNRRESGGVPGTIEGRECAREELGMFVGIGGPCGRFIRVVL